MRKKRKRAHRYEEDEDYSLLVRYSVGYCRVLSGTVGYCLRERKRERTDLKVDGVIHQ